MDHSIFVLFQGMRTPYTETALAIITTMIVTPIGRIIVHQDILRETIITPTNKKTIEFAM
jgi:hypothetical protein